MGQNPSIIFKQLYSKAKHKQRAIESIGGASGTDGLICKMNNKDHCYYVPYKDVVREFLLQGYSEQKAEKHITQWLDYELAWITYCDGFKLMGFADVI